jgi:tRNA(Arg) A34 adenosine deaminase TadA
MAGVDWTEAQAAGVAGRLLAGRGGDELAFVRAGDGALFVRGAGHRAGEPRSVVTDLIQAVCEHHPGQWRRILRARVWTTAAATEMCRGMVRVCAKRLTDGLRPAAPADAEVEGGPVVLSPLPVVPPPPAPAFELLDGPESRSDADWMAEARRRIVAAPAPGDAPRWRTDRPVCALLLDERGRGLARARNANGANRTRHAEVNLLQGWFAARGPLPPGARVLTTLKPCKMCAAMIWECLPARDRTLAVYGDEDPGPHGARTVLDPGTHERERAARTPFERAAILQLKL